MKSEQAQPENTVPPDCTISGLRVLLSLSLVVWAWALCWWAPFYFVVLYVTPFLVLLSWLVSWLVERRLAKWEFHWSPGRCRLGLATLRVAVAAMPLSSYLYGVWIADRLFQELGIEARLVFRKVSVMEEFGFDEQRGVISLYEYLEPVETADEKMLQRVLDQGIPEETGDPIVDLGWQINTYLGTLRMICISSVRPNVISAGDKQLAIEVLHFSSNYCQLR